MIEAVILAGGLGTRMLPLTETVPKPMLPVLGQPFLEYQLALLKANGIERCLLLVSYLSHVIEEYFGDGSRFGLRIAYSYETQPLGTGGALINAASLLEEGFLLLNGDTLLDIDYRAFVSAFQKGGVEMLLAAYRNTACVVASNLSVGDDGIVLDYQKQRPVGEYVDAGVLAARKSVLRYLPPQEKSSLEQEAFPRLIAERQLAAWRTTQKFFDMGTPSGLQALERHLSRVPESAR